MRSRERAITKNGLLATIAKASAEVARWPRWMISHDIRAELEAIEQERQARSPYRCESDVPHCEGGVGENDHG